MFNLQLLPEEKIILDLSDPNASFLVTKCIYTFFYLQFPVATLTDRKEYNMCFLSRFSLCRMDGYRKRKIWKKVICYLDMSQDKFLHNASSILSFVLLLIIFLQLTFSPCTIHEPNNTGRLILFESPGKYGLRYLYWTKLANNIIPIFTRPVFGQVK